MVARLLLVAAAVASPWRVAAVPKHAAEKHSYGPQNCVTLSRSPAGSCVISTYCKADVSNFSFTFDCVTPTPGQLKTYSLGVGGCDQQEEYDTEVKCERCLPPGAYAEIKAQEQASNASATAPAKKAETKRPAKAAAKAVAATAPVAAAATQRLRATKKLGKEPTSIVAELTGNSKAEHYGPSNCVSTWKDSRTGTCMMQTNCGRDDDLAIYDFGMVCVNEDDELIRHLFGMGSFSARETFDTMVKCKECMALDEFMDGDKAIWMLTRMVKRLQGNMANVTASVGRLNTQVFGGAPSPAAAGAVMLHSPQASQSPDSKPPASSSASLLKVAKSHDNSDDSSEEDSEVKATEAEAAEDVQDDSS